MQMFYNLSQALRYWVFLLYFSDRVLHFCPGPALVFNPPAFVSYTAGIIDVN
jgi:hypothetical protein